MREGWKYKKIGEVIALKKEIQRVNDCFADDDDIVYVDISSIDNTSLKIVSPTAYTLREAPSRAQQKVIDGDILISLVRPNLRNVAEVCSSADNIVASSGFAVLRAKSIDKSFLFHYVSSIKFASYLVGLTTGANYPAVRESDIRDALIPVPPLPEQQRIVSELDLLSSIIDKQKAQLKELDTLCQSIFYDMFGDPVENEKGWEVKKLNLLIQVKGRVGWKGYKKEDLRDNGPLAIGGGNLANDGSIDLTNPVYISREKFEESPEIMVERGDIILVQRGTIGKVGLVKNNIGEATINPCVLILRSHGIDNTFALHFFLSGRCQAHLKSLIRGVAQPMITQQQVNDLNIPLPPLPLQHLFAQKIQAIESQKAAISSSLAETQKLFDYTMDKYFG